MSRVARFLGPAKVVPPSPAREIWFKSLATHPGDAFPFVLMRQEETNWCWAAVGQAIEFARNKVAVSQQVIATQHIARHFPGETCVPPSRWQQNAGRCRAGECTAACGSMHAIAVVLAERSLLAGTLSTGSAVTLAAVQNQITAGKPVICRIEAQGAGHFICLAGWWIGSDGFPQVLVHDPRNGRVGQAVGAGYMPLADVAQRYPMGAAYGINNFSYAVT